MSYLCLSCAHINDKEIEEVCENCNTLPDSEFYNKFIKYSKYAVEYGYDYRLAYEDQVKKYGEVRGKYSLVAPIDYYDFLAAAALSGVTGSLAYDLVKYVANQVYKRITAKNESEHDSQEKHLLKIISDPTALNLFTAYITGYYRGTKLNKEVEKAVTEEEIIHAMLKGEEGKDDFMKAIEKSEEGGKEAFQKEFIKLLSKGALKAGELRREKPNLKEIEKSLQILKKAIKEEKKLKRKKDKGNGKKKKRKNGH